MDDDDRHLIDNLLRDLDTETELETRDVTHDTMYKSTTGLGQCISAYGPRSY